MDENQEQDPFQNLESKIGEHLDAYDRDKNELLDNLRSVKEDRDSFDPDEMPLYIHNSSRSFSRAAIALHNSVSDIDEAKQLLSKFWLADDHDRVAVLHELTGNKIHKYIEPEETEAIMEELYTESDTLEQLQENLMTRYRMYIGTDVKLLLQEVQGQLDGDYNSHFREVEDNAFEQVPAVLELTKLLKSVAEECSEGFHEEYEDGFSISKKATERPDDFVIKYSFGGERSYTLNDEGEYEASIQYNITSSIKYFYNGLEALPDYVQNFLIDLSDDEESEFDAEDLADDQNIFTIEFTYSLTADDRGSFWPYIDLSLYMDDTELPIPPSASEDAFETVGRENTSAPTPDEKELLDSIFSEEELVSLDSIIGLTAEVNTEGSELDKQQGNNIEPEVDIIQAFREKMDEIRFATIEQHIARARVLATEFMESKKQN